MCPRNESTGLILKGKQVSALPIIKIEPFIYWELEGFKAVTLLILWQPCQREGLQCVESYSISTLTQPQITCPSKKSHTVSASSFYVLLLLALSPLAYFSLWVLTFLILLPHSLWGLCLRAHLSRVHSDPSLTGLMDAWMYVINLAMGMLVVEEWEGWGGGWREELQGKRWWRVSPVSSGFHGNKLSQPVAAVHVTMGRVWQHGEGGSKFIKSKTSQEGEGQ